MGKFLMRVIINAVSLFVAVQLLAGHIIMQNNQWYAYLVLGLIFGLVNALIKPILVAKQRGIGLSVIALCDDQACPFVFQRCPPKGSPMAGEGEKEQDERGKADCFYDD